MTRGGQAYPDMGDTLFTTSVAGEEIVRLQTWGTGDRHQQHDPDEPRVSDRAVLAGIVFVLTTGISWNALPRELGCGSGVTCWRRLRDEAAAGYGHARARLRGEGAVS
jgi:transposase